MDGGYGNIFNVQRTTELYVQAGGGSPYRGPGAARAGHIGGKALIPSAEMVGARMARPWRPTWATTTS